MSALPLAFCTNACPAEDLNGLTTFIREVALEIRMGLGWNQLGLDLRMGSIAIAEASAFPERLRRLRRAIDQSGCVVTTINGFPLEPFQAPVVKDMAYKPDWNEPSRFDDTMDLARIALALSPFNEVSISTVPGSYRPWGSSRNQHQRIASAWGRWAAQALKLHRETGRRVILCPEPEPDCTLQLSSDVATFWHETLRVHGLGAAAKQLDGNDEAAEEAITKHLALCHDTCHASCLFEDQVEAIAACRKAGARPYKVQVSSCPELTDPRGNPAGLKALKALDEPRFLHQTCLKTASGTTQIRDLGELDGAFHELPKVEAIRSHFHLPVDAPSWADGLRTTNADTITGLKACLANGARHISVETYTWSILGDGTDLIRGTTRELEWLKDQMP